MGRALVCLVLTAAVTFLSSRLPAFGACCYFSALGQDVEQPSQKAFLTWDPVDQVESFTVQPGFRGNAKDFGMVIPTPSRPRLYEMPREFFKELAVFTILRPMPLDRYKLLMRGPAAPGGVGGVAEKARVRVLEAGVVGTLDYKIVVAERGRELYQWLKENGYSYAGDEATLDHYIAMKWFFTVMKIDPMQMKRQPDGTYTGEITPTRFTFAAERFVYPLRITQISVRDETEALFYVHAPAKMDMPGRWSYQLTWAPMWLQALGFAVPEKVTAQERAWRGVLEPALSRLRGIEAAASAQDPAWQPTRLEWAKKLNRTDLRMLDGTVPFDREADPAAVKQLRILRGHLREGWWLTKMRKVFRRREMSRDIEFVRASVDARPDEMEYIYILPTSPP